MNILYGRLLLKQTSFFYIIQRNVKTCASDSKLKILFFGTDRFSETHLKALLEEKNSSEYNVLDKIEVVSPNSKCEIFKFALKNNLKVYEWPELPHNIEAIFDTGIIVSFGHMIPGRLIKQFKNGILNVHPSLLPKFRGACPLVHTILSGEDTTGISIMKIRPKKFDEGPLLVQKEFEIPENCTTNQLAQLASSFGASMLVDCLQNIHDITPQEQVAPSITFPRAHKINLEHSFIDWDMTEEEIYRLYRAVAEKIDLRSLWGSTTIRLHEMLCPSELSDDCRHSWAKNMRPYIKAENLKPGMPFYRSDKDILCISCKNGYVAFRKITIKRKMSAKNFYNGYLTKSEYKASLFLSQNNGLDFYFKNVSKT